MVSVWPVPRSVIVVDDPHGYVVPSDGVLILGRSHTSHLITQGYRPMELEQPRRVTGKSTSIPVVVKEPRKTRRLHKGLRP